MFLSHLMQISTQYLIGIGVGKRMPAVFDQCQVLIIYIYLFRRLRIKGEA